MELISVLFTLFGQGVNVLSTGSNYLNSRR